MPEPGGKSILSASPRQLALVAILAVIFVVVLIVQFGGSSGAEEAAWDENTAGAEAPRPPRETGAPAAQTPAPAAQRRAGARPWPTLSLQDVLSYDPFATPPAFSAESEAAGAGSSSPLAADAANRQDEEAQKQAERERVLARLRQEGVKAILGSRDKGRVAVVGSQTIHVGDVLDGFRVIAVEPDGLVLELPAAQ